MDVLPLLLTLFVVPGVDALAPVDVITDGDMVAIDLRVGDGRLAGSGDIATFHYSLAEEGGKELADTTLRGLPFAVRLDSAGPLAEAVQGMRLGGARTVYLPGNRLLAAENNLFPRDTELVLTLRLVSLKQPRPRPNGPTDTTRRAFLLNAETFLPTQDRYGILSASFQALTAHSSPPIGTRG